VSSFKNGLPLGDRRANDPESTHWGDRGTSEAPDPKERVTCEDLSTFSMWEIAPLWEGLERKGISPSGTCQLCSRSCDDGFPKPPLSSPTVMDTLRG